MCFALAIESARESGVIFYVFVFLFQVITGINRADFVSNPVNSLVFKQTISNVLNSSTSKEVQVLNVQDYIVPGGRAYSARSLFDVDPMGARRTSAVLVNGTVLFRIPKYSDAQTAFGAIQQEVRSLSRSGGMTALLRKNAFFEFATNLTTATVLSIGFSRRGVPTAMPTYAPTRTPFIGGTVAGAVLFGLVVLPTAFLIAFYYLRRRTLVVESIPPRTSAPVSEEIMQFPYFATRTIFPLDQPIEFDDGKTAVDVITKHSGQWNRATILFGGSKYDLEIKWAFVKRTRTAITEAVFLRFPDHATAQEVWEHSRWNRTKMAFRGAKRDVRVRWAWLSFLESGCGVWAVELANNSNVPQGLYADDVQAVAVGGGVDDGDAYSDSDNDTYLKQFSYNDDFAVPSSQEVVVGPYDDDCVDGVGVDGEMKADGGYAGMADAWTKGGRGRLGGEEIEI